MAENMANAQHHAQKAHSAVAGGEQGAEGASEMSRGDLDIFGLFSFRNPTHLLQIQNRDRIAHWGEHARQRSPEDHHLRVGEQSGDHLQGASRGHHQRGKEIGG